MANGSQAMRHVFIITTIKQRECVSARELAQEYEVSERTIRRDIEFLRYQRRVPLAYDAARHGWYLSEPYEHLPAIDLSAGDAFALCIAEKVLEQYSDTPLHATLADIFRRIEAGLADQRLTLHPSWLEQGLTLRPVPATTVDGETWQTVFHSLEEHRELLLRYQAPNRAPEQRRVQPWHVLAYKGAWYLLAYCCKRKAPRLFLFSRMKSARLGKETYTPPPKETYEELINHRFGIFIGEGDYLVRLQVRPDQAPYIKERLWHPQQKITHQSSGRIVLEFPATHLLEVTRWVLSWGSGLKVLNPPELKSAVTAELNKALSRYQSQKKR